MLPLKGKFGYKSNFSEPIGTGEDILLIAKGVSALEEEDTIIVRSRGEESYFTDEIYVVKDCGGSFINISKPFGSKTNEAARLV